tara:strand:+ start:39473 stop:40504 length:1032 start_codon:yes stop_codon:yes gene_type:complete
LDVISLRKFLLEKLGKISKFEVLQFPYGYSNLTYFIKTENKKMVLRRPPYGSTVKSGHDMKREFNILSSLKKHFNKVPLPIIYCNDKSIIGDEFYIMEKVDGVIFRGSKPPFEWPKPNLMPSLVNSFIDSFTKLHSLNIKKIGLENFGKPKGYVNRQVNGWIKRYNNAKTHNFNGINKTISWLSNHLPKKSKTAIIHNDFKFDNIMFRIHNNKAQVNAILDWEMSTIGDPLMDLGTSLGYWIHYTDPEKLQNLNLNITTVKGTPSREKLVQLYCEKTGSSVNNIVFYFVFGLFKIAVIIQQIYFRYVNGFTKDLRFKNLDKGVELLGIMALQAIQKKKIDYLF